MKNGDVVQVVSGGPLMTICKTSDVNDYVSTDWFEGVEAKSGSFHKESLRVWKLEEEEKK